MSNVCPQHGVEDACYSDALERAWTYLKVRHFQCSRTDCVVDEEFKTITHGNTGVTAHVEYWRRGGRWTA